MRRDSGAAVGLSGLGHTTTGRRVTNVSAGVAPPALAQEGTANYTAGAPAVVTLGSNVTIHSLLIGLIITDQNTSVAVSDNQSNVWTEAVSGNSSTGRPSIWWAKAGNSGPLTVTATGSNNNAGMVLYEVSRVSAVTPVDITGNASSVSNAPVTGPNLSGLAGSTDFVVYWAVYNPPGSAAVGGIWTSDYSCLIAGQHFLGAAWAVTGPSVTGPTLNPGTNSAFGLAAVAFHP